VWQNKKSIIIAVSLVCAVIVWPIERALTQEIDKPGPKGVLNLGQWTVDTLDGLIQSASKIEDPGERIAFLSKNFLGTEYMGDTLIGSYRKPEELVINLSGMDCFTYLDYVEAMRISDSYEEFADNLKKVRYRGGNVSYEDRNHFFTAWAETPTARIVDETKNLAPGITRHSTKTLNIKDDGAQHLKSIPNQRALIHYIPTKSLDENVIQSLKNGDYIGVYSPLAWLDVSHTGIFIMKGNKALFRHSSSKRGAMGVIDEGFLEYFANKPGIVVLRAR